MTYGIPTLLSPSLIFESLNKSGFALSSCRAGKQFELDFAGNDKEAAMVEAKKIAESVLCNPLIEVFNVEVAQ